MRLIDADNIRVSEGYHVDGLVYIPMRDIKRQPTAYDVDMVVEELKDSSRTYCEEYRQRENNLYLLDAIEIVKKGGAE